MEVSAKPFHYETKRKGTFWNTLRLPWQLLESIISHTETTFQSSIFKKYALNFFRQKLVSLFVVAVLQFLHFFQSQLFPFDLPK